MEGFLVTHFLCIDNDINNAQRMINWLNLVQNIQMHFECENVFKRLTPIDDNKTRIIQYNHAKI